MMGVNVYLDECMRECACLVVMIIGSRSGSGGDGGGESGGLCRR